MDDKRAENDAAAGRTGDSPSGGRSPTWGVALFAAVGAGFLLWWLSMALRYPYFYLADMDLLAPFEALNLNSGREAWVTLHPGYGMYVLDAFTLRIASFFHLVSVANFKSLESSLSPLLPMAELTSFFRLHSPILVFLTALSLWATVARVGRFTPAMSALVFAAIASSEGLAYHAAVIRVDLYSVFFWSLSLPLAALAGTVRRPSVHMAFLVATGFFLGLAFLTKVQSGVHLAAAAIVYGLARCLPDSAGAVPSEERTAAGSRRAGLILAAINCCALAGLLLAARYTAGQQFTLHGVVAEPGTYAGAPSRRALAAVAGALLLLIGQLPRPGAQGALALTSLAARAATQAVTGGLLAILSPLILYRDPATGLGFALHNLQNLFWTDLFVYRTEQTTETILRVVSEYRWWMIAALAAAWTLMTVSMVVGRRPRAWSLMSMATAWVCFAGAVSLVVVRTAPRDVIWFDTAYALATFVLLGLALRLATRGRRAITAAAAGITMCVCVGNAVRLAEFPGRMDTNYHLYGWTEMPWFNIWFSPPRYEQIMEKRYPEAARALAARQAREHYRLRGIVEHVFQNADVNLSNVGPLAVGQPLWRNHQEWTVSAFPKGYAFSHVIDPLEVTVRRRVFLSHVKKHEEWLDRIVPPPAEAGGQTPGDPVRALSILPRRDIEIVLFATIEDLGRVGASQKPEASLKIPAGDVNPLQLSLENKGQELRLEGAIVVHYSALPVGDFMGPYVFLVREKSLPAAYGFYTPKGGPEGEANPKAPLGGAAEGGVADEAAGSNVP